MSEMLSIDEFCRLTGISRSTWYNMQRKQRGPKLLRVGKLVKVTREAAQEWQAQLEAGSACSAA